MTCCRRARAECDDDSISRVSRLSSAWIDSGFAWKPHKRFAPQSPPSRCLEAGAEADPSLRAALGWVKRVQSQRFAGTYADLLARGPYAAATRFFLDELYSDKDYAERDAQFARIAGAIERLFPAQMRGTAVDLAELHALTEELDQAMAVASLAHDDAPQPTPSATFAPGARLAGERIVKASSPWSWASAEKCRGLRVRPACA